MRQDYTHFSVILDRTGSMQEIRDDTIGGFNAFLGDQKKQPGQATFTLVQFDSQDPYEVLHRFAPIAQVDDLTRATYVPRGSTPLLDAVGRGINDLEKSLGDLAAEERPSRVVFAIVTDGQENCSQEFRKPQIEKMIQEKIEGSAWQFVYLGADLSTFDDARGLGVHAGAVMRYEKSAAGVQGAFARLSRRSSAYRAGRLDSMDLGEDELPQQKDVAEPAGENEERDEG